MHSVLIKMIAIFLLLLLLKILFCVGFSFFKIWLAFVPVCQGIEVALFRVVFKFNDFQQEPGICY